MLNSMQTLTKLIKDLCEQTVDSEYEVHFRDSYGGRGMFDSRCVGITGSERGCRQLITEVIKELHDDCDFMEFGEAVSILMGYDKDSMGYDVILYWPGMEPLPQEEEEHDGQPDEAQEWHDFDPDC